MSLLTSFFQDRHKKNSKNQTGQKNQTIVSIFNSAPSKPIKRVQPIKPAQVIKTIQPKTKIIKKQIKQDKKKGKRNNKSDQSEAQQQIIEQKTEMNISKKKLKKKLKAEKKKAQKASKVIEQTKVKQHAAKQNNKQTQQNEQNEQQQQQNLDSTVFIGNVPLSSNHKSMKKYFQKYGKVLKVWFRSIPVQQSKIPKKALHILKKYQDGADSMNAYVKFQKQSEALAACEANGQLIQDKNIKVTLCTKIDVDFQTTIFLGNLPRNVKDQQLWDTFKNIGQIKSVRVIRNSQTHEGIGIGYIKFDTKETMKKAISEMNGKQIGGRPMRIKKAVPKQRIQKKFKKLKEKKQAKFKKSHTHNSSKENNKDNNQQGEDNQKGDNKRKFIKKTKPIHKNEEKNHNPQHNHQKPSNFKPQGTFPPRNNYAFDRKYENPRENRSFTPRTSEVQSNNQYTNVASDVIRTKYGFKGTKKTLQ